MKLTKSPRLWPQKIILVFGVGACALPWEARAQGWTLLTNSPSGCTDFVCSSDGRIIYALTDEVGNLYQSTNFGADWSELLSNAGSPFSCSADGAKVAAGLEPWVSTNFGETFRRGDYGNPAWSASGNLLLVSQIGALTTTNDGATWATNLEQSGLQFNAVSANGKMIVVASQQSLYVSTNSGFSFSQGLTPSSYEWTAVTCTADGATVVAAESGTNLQLVFTRDSGKTWQTKTPEFPLDGRDRPYFRSLVSSADGSLLIANMLFNIYVSRDLGSTWVLDTTPFALSLQPVACTADGTELIAESNGYAVVQYLAPPLAIAPSAGQLTLSWPAPSSQYTLQQAPDLASTNWLPVTNAITVTNYRNNVTVVTPVSGNVFYRLYGPN